MSGTPAAMRRRAPKKKEPGEVTEVRFTWERALRGHVTLPVLGVGFLIATYVNAKSGSCWPSVATLAKDASVTEGTIRKHCRTLEAQGWITRDQGGGTQSTTYHLTHPEVTPPPAAVKRRRPQTEAEKLAKRRTPVKDDTGVKDDSPVKDDRHPLSRMTDTPVKDDSQSINEQSIDQSPLREASSSRPPKGVSIAKWNVVSPVLNEVVRVLGSDGDRFFLDWKELTGKAAVCQGIYTMLRNGHSSRTVVELLTEDGYIGMDHPARALYTRVKNYQERRPAATPVVVTATSKPATSSPGAVVVADAMALLTEKLSTNPTNHGTVSAARLSGGRNAR